MKKSIKIKNDYIHLIATKELEEDIKTVLRKMLTKEGFDIIIKDKEFMEHLKGLVINN